MYVCDRIHVRYGRDELNMAVKYRNKYILDGLNSIPEEMEKDLDIAYGICSSLHDSVPCKCCGKCCTQPYITVMDNEVERIADDLGMDLYDFVTKYLYREDDRWLFSKPKHGSCAFLGENKRCTIWPSRPEICRDFPYLVSKLMSMVYLAIVYKEYEMDMSYMDDTWPCTGIIKETITKKVEEERKRRSV